MNRRAASLRVMSATVHLALTWEASGVLLSCWVPCSCMTVTVPDHAATYSMSKETDMSLRSAVPADGRKCSQNSGASCTQARDADNCLLMLRFFGKGKAVSTDVRPHKEVFMLHCMLPQLTLLDGTRAGVSKATLWRSVDHLQPIQQHLISQWENSLGDLPLQAQLEGLGSKVQGFACSYYQIMNLQVPKARQQ